MMNARFTADDVLSDINFQDDNLLNNFLVITKITESEQEDESQHHISLALNGAWKARAGS